MQKCILGLSVVLLSISSSVAFASGILYEDAIDCESRFPLIETVSTKLSTSAQLQLADSDLVDNNTVELFLNGEKILSSFPIEQDVTFTLETRTEGGAKRQE